MTPAQLSALLRNDLGNAKVAATPGGIEAQEAQGVRSMIAGQLLPAKGPWDELQRLGVVKGEAVDELFVRATLPGGWRVVQLGDSRASSLQDANGKEIASIFYKAAFYDRKAHMFLVSAEDSI